MLSHERRVAGPRVQLRHRDDEHHRTGIVGVVERVGVEIQSRKRALSHLIRDAPRFLIAPIVDPRSLKAAETRERGVEKLTAIQHGALPTGGERVAAIQRRVQGHARLHREPLVARTVEQRKGRDVAQVGAQNGFRDAVPRRVDAHESLAPATPYRFASVYVLAREW